MDIQDFIQIRHYLHQHPEVSGKEKATSKFIAEQMDKIWPEAGKEIVGEHGLVFTRQCENAERHVAFRCELDALPIQEVNNIDYRSQYTGVSHKCGHDGHMTILLRLAALINENPPLKTKVSLIFQPAEENGKGAQEICKLSKLFKSDKPDHIFALHNVPGYKKWCVYTFCHFSQNKVYWKNITRG